MAFTTQTEIEALLQITITDPVQIASITRAISEAETSIRNYTKQEIDPVYNEVLTVDSRLVTQEVTLPELPIISVAQVIEDDEVLVDGTDYKVGQHGIVYRIGRPWSVGIQNLVFTYSHGFETIPNTIKDVATRAAARAFQAGLRSADTDGVIGVASKSLGDYSVSYQSDSSGGVGEGILGASSATFLLKSEKRMLDKFRQKGI